MKYTLKTPIELKNGDKLTEIDLKRPTWGDIRNLRLADYKNISSGELLAVAAACSGQAENILARMDGADAVEVSTLIIDFLANSPS